MTVQGDALLKTSSDKYKKKFLIIMGNELYIQRSKDSQGHEIMHLLEGTFISVKPAFEASLPSEEGSDLEIKQNIYPVKIGLGPIKSRIIYFTSQEKQETWMKVFQEASGNRDIDKFYEFGKVLGKG